MTTPEAEAAKIAPCRCYGANPSEYDKRRMAEGKGCLYEDPWNKDGDHLPECPALLRPAIAAALRDVIMEEREACAKEVETWHGRNSIEKIKLSRHQISLRIATAIRARPTP